MFGGGSRLCGGPGLSLSGCWYMSRELEPMREAVEVGVIGEVDFVHEVLYEGFVQVSVQLL